MPTPPEWKALVGAYEDKMAETSSEAIKPVVERLKFLVDKLSIRFGAFTVETHEMGESLFHSKATCTYSYKGKEVDHVEPLGGHARYMGPEEQVSSTIDGPRA